MDPIPECNRKTGCAERDESEENCPKRRTFHASPSPVGLRDCNSKNKCLDHDNSEEFSESMVWALYVHVAQKTHLWTESLSPPVCCGAINRRVSSTDGESRKAQDGSCSLRSHPPHE
jgi:hypothetical protein